MRFSDLSPAEKWEHIWIYYKFHILGGILLILLVVYFVSSMVGRVPSALNVEVVSGNILPGSTAGLQRAATAALIPPGKREVVQISSLPIGGTLESPQNANAVMALAAMIAAHNVDVMVTDETDYFKLRSQGYFENLRQVGLPASYLDRYGLPAVSGGAVNGPVYGLNFSGSVASRAGIRAAGNNVVAIVRGAPNTGEAVRFLEWLWR